MNKAITKTTPAAPLTPFTQPVHPQLSPWEQLRKHKQRSHKFLAQLALGGGLLLGSLVGAALYSFTGSVSVGAVALAAIVGAMWAAGGRAFSNQPANAESMALVLQHLDEVLYQQASLTAALTEHRQFGAGLQRDIKGLRAEVFALSKSMEQKRSQPLQESPTTSDEDYWTQGLN